jgi:hypothetical protein
MHACVPFIASLRKVFKLRAPTDRPTDRANVRAGGRRDLAIRDFQRSVKLNFNSQGSKSTHQTNLSCILLQFLSLNYTRTRELQCHISDLC